MVTYRGNEAQDVEHDRKCAHSDRVSLSIGNQLHNPKEEITAKQERSNYLPFHSIVHVNNLVARAITSHRKHRPVYHKHGENTTNCFNGKTYHGTTALLVYARRNKTSTKVYTTLSVGLAWRLEAF